MKKLIVLLCLLLCGCARQTAPVSPEAVPEATAVSAMAGLYDPDHPMEKNHPGLVRVYPLPPGKIQGIQAFGKDILVLSGYGNTKMTLFTGEDLRKTAAVTLDFPLPQEDPSLQIHKSSLSFFDPVRQETVVLDHRLQEVRRIAVPEGLSGSPILSEDNRILYYCTPWAVMAWNLDTGIRRTVRELSYEHQELTALHLDDQILECTIQDQAATTKLLLSAGQGTEIHSLPEKAALHTGDSRYFAALPAGHQTLLFFGNTEESPSLLLPEQHWQQQFYLPEDYAVITVASSETGNVLHYYELNTGILRASLPLENLHAPKSIVNTRNHAIYILAHDPDANRDILCRWDVLGQKPDPGNLTSYKAAYPSTGEELEQCREYANAIAEKYGISIRIWEDAVALQPWDYRFEPEMLAPVLQQELTLLDKRLAQYPKAVLDQTKAHFQGLNLCLVRGITGTGESGSLSTATGIQFFDKNSAYVVITTGRYSEQALYHELYHVMQTHILTESTALDRWETLNPSEFSYGTQSDIYLQGQTRAFVDRYSMVALKEDQARILENAMLQGKKDLFRAEYMQRKLSAMCTAIREAYDLQKHPENLPWEQYLVTPLAPEA